MISRTAFLSFWVFSSVNLSAFECPTDPTQWIAARVEIAKIISGRDDESKKSLGDCLKSSSALFRANSKLAICFHDFIEAYDAQSLPPKKEGQLLISDRRYQQESAPFVGVPEALQTPQFLVAMASRDIAAAEAYLKQLNKVRTKKGLAPYEHLVFKGFAPPLDNREGNRRFLVYDPGDSNKIPVVEKWVNFVIPQDFPGTQVSVISSVKEQTGEKVTYFADHKIGKRKVVHSYESEKAPTPDCIRCHLSATPLTIDKNTVENGYELAADRINATIKGIPMNQKHFEPRTFTTGMIKLDPERIPLKLVEATSNSIPGNIVDPESAANVREALSCGTCHDGSERARVSAVKIHQLQSKVLYGEMPPGKTLTKEERRALLRTMASYQHEVPEQSLLYHHLVSAPCDLNVEAKMPRGKEH